ncbi:hypothetical protein Tco_0054500 [Tanacetum coccineum]
MNSWGQVDMESIGLDIIGQCAEIGFGAKVHQLFPICCHSWTKISVLGSDFFGEQRLQESSLSIVIIMILINMIYKGFMILYLKWIFESYDAQASSFRLDLQLLRFAMTWFVKWDLLNIRVECSHSSASKYGHIWVAKSFSCVSLTSSSTLVLFLLQENQRSRS